MIWRARSHRFVFPRGPIVMGILNVTPDSFSDGGQFNDVVQAVERGVEMVREGAEIVDIGGESTRPGAKRVSADEEALRVIPVIRQLRERVEVVLSVDTMKPSVAEAALKVGVDMVNDVGASRTEAEMWRLVAKYEAGYVAMHMQGLPQSMQENPAYGNVMEEVLGFFVDRMLQLKEHGVDLDQVAIDPGIGFGKTMEHNITLLRNTSDFLSLSRPILIGLSRKSFLGSLTGAVQPEDRMAGGLGATLWAAARGARVFRTHDVRSTVDALRVWEVLASRRANPESASPNFVKSN